MKTLFLSIIAVVGLSIGSQAQEETGAIMADNAIGIRISPGAFPDIALSYQKQMISENNRLELNLGMKTGYAYSNTSAFFAKGYFHWAFNIVDKLNWYAGPGVGVLFITYDSDALDNVTAPMIGGEGGVEYRFDFPLQVSLSIRPSYYFYGDNDGYYYVDTFDNFDFSVGVGARYTF